MNKQFKFFLTSAAIAAALVGAVSCQKDYSGDIDDLNKKVNELTTKLGDLQSKIDNGEIVTGVTPIAGGIQVKTNKGTYDIVGQKGDKGDNGAPGSVVTIDAEGYWCIDGKRTDPAIKAKGDKGDTIYYIPNADGYFYKVVNGGEPEKTEISFLAPGTITAVYDPEAGTLSFYNVKGYEGAYVLSLDGKLKSLVFLPQVYIDGVEGMLFSNYAFTPQALDKADSADEIQIDKKGAKVVNVNPTIIAEYHVNPANADLSFLKEGESTNLSFVKQANAKYVPTRAKASDDFDATPIFKSFKDGILTVEVQVTGVPATDEFISVIALNVELEDGEFVTSDYATLKKEDLDQLGIAFPNAYAEKNLQVKDAHYRRASKGISKVDDKAYVSDYAAWTTGEQALEDAEVTCDVSVKYTDSLDLKTIVAAHKVTEEGIDADAKPVELTDDDLEALGLTWEFAVVKNYKIGKKGSETDQRDFVQWEKIASDGLFVPKVYSTAGEASIGRTPIIRAALKHGDDVVEYAYIKVYISDKSVDPYDTVYDFDPETFAFACKPDTLLTNVEDMNVNIYNALKLSKDAFHALYDTFVPTYEVEGITNVGTASEVENLEVEGTHIIQWIISAEDAFKYAGKTIQHVVAYQSSNNPKLIVTILLQAKVDDFAKSYNLTHEANYLREYWDAAYTETKFNVSVPTFVGDSIPENCVFVNDPNASFVTWPKDSKIGTPGVLKVDENGAVTKIQYFFCKDMLNIKKVGGIDVKYEISADNLQLFVTIDEKKELVATIDNNGTDLPNTITLNKADSLAKVLLNTKDLTVLIGAKGIVCNDDTKEVNITFDGKDHFVARYVRPVEVSPVAGDHYKDGVDYGEKYSYIVIEDLIAPIDWRGRKFSEYPNYWGFYGPFEVKVDDNIGHIFCNLNGVYQQIPNTLEVKYRTIDEMKALVGEDHVDDLKDTQYGYVTYKNNGTVVDDFELYINVTVKYGWGILTTDQAITVPVWGTFHN